MKPSERKQRLVEELADLYEKLDTNKLYGFPNQKDTQQWLANVASVLKNLDESDYQEIVRLSKTVGLSESREERKKAAKEINQFLGRKVAEYKRYDFGYLDRKVEDYPEDITNYVHDKELRGRCLDLLQASSKFDRVINQATQVLEDRIRTKSGLQEHLVGEALVNKVLNPDLSKTVINISSDADEHQGFCNICRGMMGTFRNPSHHHLTDTITREEAFKVCAFVDTLLSILERAKNV
ncbi:MAG TPA: TIGR02391 family protein [Candidatus Pacebacteria bacterium]|nr:MAG: hypothetical protein UX00_C0004G0060 [Microgenomates group bacterium GW2011_GWB1_45_17]KKU23942.1 MAG: hypothetical protein UX35_C0003G0078 [Microgenomates group bacterium GW2011_GWA1_46_15]KKU24665.1 MAG: hypothetical protein UX36_C0001G0282 [Microgenomates group bacterium GW2011_GWC1_46_15]HAV15190.1 TIGR02391 family protein [Candidatus Paceibacterota bacterium]HCR11099.1 TIGR02391 family protein [Candidatus Paceibacterota bacterium]